MRWPSAATARGRRARRDSCCRPPPPRRLPSLPAGRLSATGCCGLRRCSGHECGLREPHCSRSHTPSSASAPGSGPAGGGHSLSARSAWAADSTAVSVAPLAPPTTEPCSAPSRCTGRPSEVRDQCSGRGHRAAGAGTAPPRRTSWGRPGAAWRCQRTRPPCRQRACDCRTALPHGDRCTRTAAG